MAVAGASEKIPGKFYDKGGIVFNVQHPDFAAKGDGVADDTTAIQLALDTASTGDIVFLPAGTYNISAKLKLNKDGIQLVGVGQSTDPKVGTIIDATVSVSPMVAVTSDNVQIHNIYFEGFQVADTAIHLDSSVEGLARIVLDNIVTTVCGTGLLIDTCILSEFRGCTFQNGNIDIQGLATSLTFTACFVNKYQGLTEGSYHVSGTSHYINFIGCGADNGESYGYWVEGDSEAVVILGSGAEVCALGFARILGDNVGIYNCHGANNGDDLNGSTDVASGVTAVGAKFLSVIGFDDFSPNGGASRLANHHLNNTTEDCYIRGGLADKGVRDQGTRNTIFGLLDEQISGRATAFGYKGDMFVANVIQTDVATLANNATPTVLNGTAFKTGGTTTITDFDDGVVGQKISILSEHSITITDGSPIVLNGGANFVMVTSDTLVLKMFNDQIWHELSRSVN